MLENWSLDTEFCILVESEMNVLPWLCRVQHYEVNDRIFRDLSLIIPDKSSVQLHFLCWIVYGILDMSRMLTVLEEFPKRSLSYWGLRSRPLLVRVLHKCRCFSSKRHIIL